jgi:uncharacterized membrane protein
MEGDAPVSRIVVIGFDSEDEAHAALQTLREVEKAGEIKFEGTAVVAMDEHGKVHVKNDTSAATTTGAVVGGVMGGLLFVVFPIAGIAAGAAVGAGLAAVTAKGVSSRFRDEIAAELTPGTAALFLEIKDADADAAILSLQQYHGRVIQTTLDAETEDQLRAALL